MRSERSAFLAARPRKASVTTTNLIHAAIIGCSAAAGVGLVAGLTSLYGPPNEQAAMIQSVGKAEAAPATAPVATPPSMETVAAIAPAATPITTFENPKSDVRPFSADDLQPTPSSIDRVAQAHAVAENEAPASSAATVAGPSASEASIASLADVEPVDVAETPDEVAALEAEMAAAGAEFFKVPIEPAVAPKPEAEAEVALPVAWTNSWVNMRASPDNEGRTITIVPSGAEIRAQPNCRHWCRVAFDGQDGYIYKSFIRRE